MVAFADFAIVAAIGGGVGQGEIVARYRDAPFKAVNSKPGWIYLGINAVAALAALGLIRVLDLPLGIDVEVHPDALKWVQIIVGGFGALAVLRSAVFTVRAGDEDVAIGPSAFLNIILQALDRQIDRGRAGERASAAKRVMEGVSFIKARDALPVFCLALMQNLSAREQLDLSRAIEDLHQSPRMSDRAKAINLGVILLNVVGDAVLEKAVEALRVDIQDAPAEP